MLVIRKRPALAPTRSRAGLAEQTRLPGATKLRVESA